ncbi:MAG: DUF2218 domain-containing protein [Pseudomonadota bacterium]
MQASATFKTPEARRYVDTLCAHFGPKALRSDDQAAALIRFPFGECELTPMDGALFMRAQAEDAVRLTRVTDTMTSYLERFAFRENPHLRWQIAKEPHHGGSFTGSAQGQAQT